MTKNRIIILFIMLLIVCVSVDAQTRKNNRKKTRHNAKTTRVQPQAKSQNVDTLALVAPTKEEPKYKSLNDPLVVQYILGGFAREKKLHLVANAEYGALTLSQKQNVLNKVAQDFAGFDMIIYSGGQQRELWLNSGGGIRMIESWNNDSLKIEDYLPLELNRHGETKVFYYVGGLLNGGNGSMSYSLNLRAGSYLYKNLLDVSATLNLGGNKPDGGENQFTGDLGVDSRAYLPFRIKNVNLAPYAGVGVSWSFAPESYYEVRFLAGGCWFVGPGSFDIGLQYGLKSEYSVTLGYTFRIPSKK